MATYILNRPKKSAVYTMKFKSFEQARDFANKSAAVMRASKPYKRMLYINGSIVPVWMVSIPSGKYENATLQQIAA
jgi:hypothetical protein